MINLALTEKQINALVKIHKQIILNNLSELDLSKDIEKQIIEESNTNFNNFLNLTQKLLKEESDMDQIRLELQEDIKKEKLIKKHNGK